MKNHLHTERWACTAQPRKGIRGIISSGCMKGSEQLPQSYFAASLGGSPATSPQASGCIVGLPQANKNSCNIMVELSAKRRFQTYLSFWKRPDLTKVEKSFSGTYLDEHVCMALGQFAHFDDSKGPNPSGR